VSANGGGLERIERALRAGRYAVLATTGDGQPHASFMAYAAVEHGHRLIIATYRDTRKFRNMQANPRVALLIDCPADAAEGRLALTAVGRARELHACERDAALSIYRAAHPGFDAFTRSDDCAVFAVDVDWFERAVGVDQVDWCAAMPPRGADDPGETPA